MANTGTFRSAINGFNRQDVMDYLESASQRYETLKKERNELDRMRNESQARVKELEGIQEEAEALREQAAEAKAQLEQLEQETAQLKAELDAARETGDSLNGQLSALQEQLAGQQKEKEDLQQALAQCAEERDAALSKPAEDPAVAEALRGEVNELKARLAQLEASQEENARKAQEYDSMRDRIATLELNAARRAADIEDAARAEARSVAEQAEQQARELIALARQDADALLAKARQEEGDFLLRREENRRSFRDSLQGAALETEASSSRLSEELQRLCGQLQGIAAALTDTAARFEPAKEPEDACGKPVCCEEEPIKAEPAAGKEMHRCHE